MYIKQLSMCNVYYPRNPLYFLVFVAETWNMGTGHYSMVPSIGRTTPLALDASRSPSPIGGEWNSEDKQSHG